MSASSSPPMPQQVTGQPWALPVQEVSPAMPSPQDSQTSNVESDLQNRNAEQQSSPSHRRDKVLYVRVNMKEKEKIVTQAHESRLSISRYLTRIALEKRPPPTDDDRKRIEVVLLLLKRMEGNVGRLHAEASRMRLFSVLPGMEADFDATRETARGLIRELAKRL